MLKHAIVLGRIRRHRSAMLALKIDRTIVERIVGHQRAVVQIGRQHKRHRTRPVHDRQRFRLGVRIERIRAVLVRKVAIQVEAVRVRPTIEAALIAQVRHLVAVRIHRRHQVDARRCQQRRDALVGAVVLAQILGQQEQQLAADDLVAVHVGHVLEFGHTDAMAARLAGHLEHPQFAMLHGLADGVEARDGWVLGGQVVQLALELLVVVMRVGGGKEKAVAAGGRSFQDGRHTVTDFLCVGGWIRDE